MDDDLFRAPQGGSPLSRDEPPYGRPPYGRPPYGQPPYSQPPYGGAQPYPAQQYAPQHDGPQHHGAPYGQPPAGYGTYGTRTNGMAVASLVLGILWLYWIGSVLALVFGYVALRQVRERGDQGRGLALAGIVLGWTGVGILALVALVGGIAAATGS